MPIYDRQCPHCGCVWIDRLERIETPDPPCSSCGTLTKRAFLTHTSAAVAPDGIPGGIEIKHGICWPDGTPRRFDSRSEMKRVAQDMGVQNVVRHVPLPGSDKSPHTSRWVSVPESISEEERIRRWHEHERMMGYAPMKPRESTSGVHIVGEGPDRLSDIIADSIHKIESSGFHEADYRG